MPSTEAAQPGRFDRLADWVDRWTSRAVFFAFCLGLVIGWLPTFLVVRNVDTWQLLINTPTTVITFLLVALAANVGRRAWAAIHSKINALALALIAVLRHLGGRANEEAIAELADAIGLEEREAS